MSPQEARRHLIHALRSVHFGRFVRVSFTLARGITAFSAGAVGISDFTDSTPIIIILPLMGGTVFAIYNWAFEAKTARDFCVGTPRPNPYPFTYWYDPSPPMPPSIVRRPTHRHKITYLLTQYTYQILATAQENWWYQMDVMAIYNCFNLSESEPKKLPFYGLLAYQLAFFTIYAPYYWFVDGYESGQFLHKHLFGDYTDPVAQRLAKAAAKLYQYPKAIQFYRYAGAIWQGIAHIDGFIFLFASCHDIVNWPTHIQTLGGLGLATASGVITLSGYFAIYHYFGDVFQQNVQATLAKVCPKLTLQQAPSGTLTRRMGQVIKTFVAIEVLLQVVDAAFAIQQGLSLAKNIPTPVAFLLYAFTCSATFIGSGLSNYPYAKQEIDQQVESGGDTSYTGKLEAAALQPFLLCHKYNIPTDLDPTLLKGHYASDAAF